jgi:undecaprenyl-diphosphatase
MSNPAIYLSSTLIRSDYLGSWLFLIIAFIECAPILGSIFPGGTLIFIGGILAAQGDFNVAGLVIFAAIGAMTGDYLSYTLGRWGGKWVREKKIIKNETILKSELFFYKYGAPGIFWARITGSTWATMPFISGSMRVKRRIFLFWNCLGAIGWSLTRVLFGYFSGNIIAIVIKKWTNRLGVIILIALLVFTLYWFIKKHHENIWRWYVTASENFTKKLFSFGWFKKIMARYPVLDEFFKIKISQEKILGGFICLVILSILYILVLALDLV